MERRRSLNRCRGTSWRGPPKFLIIVRTVLMSRRALQSASGPIAQRLEQGTHNPLVPGSNPGGPTILDTISLRLFGVFFVGSYRWCLLAVNLPGEVGELVSPKTGSGQSFFTLVPVESIRGRQRQTAAVRRKHRNLPIAIRTAPAWHPGYMLPGDHRSLFSHSHSRRMAEVVKERNRYFP